LKEMRILFDYYFFIFFNELSLLFVRESFYLSEILRIMQLQTKLNKPYPMIVGLKNKLLLSFGFGLFVYLFLLFFQPFGIEEDIRNKFVYLSGFGFITIGVMLSCYIIIPLIVPSVFNEERWTIAKEIIFILCNVALISFFNNWYNSIVGVSENSRQLGLVSFIVMTLSVGVFPITFLTFIRESLLAQKQERIASEITSKIQVEKNEKELPPSPLQNIKISSESKSEDFEIPLANLLFIKSEGNYCQVFHKKKGVLKKELLRTSLKSIENQLNEYSEIIRCHRSYIVNKNQISKISGNARSYNLHFDDYDNKLPVSRSFNIKDLS